MSSSTASHENLMTKDNFFGFGGDLVIRIRVDRLVGQTELETETKILIFEQSGDEHGNNYVGVVGYKHVFPERQFYPLMLDRTLGVMKGDAKTKLGEILEEWRQHEHPSWLEHRSIVAVEVANGIGHELEPRSSMLEPHLARMHGAMGALLRIGDAQVTGRFDHAWMVCNTYYHLGKMFGARFYSARDKRKMNREPVPCSAARTINSMVGL
jgi:hypothetical protein